MYCAAAESSAVTFILVILVIYEIEGEVTSYGRTICREVGIYYDFNL